MKKLLLLIIFITTNIFAQTSDTQYNNFKLKEKELVWQKIFNAPNISKDSLTKIVKNTIKSNFGINSLNFKTDNISTDCTGLMQLNGSNSSFIVNIDIKDNKYRVTIKSIIIHGVLDIYKNINATWFFTKKRATKIRNGTAIHNGLDCLDAKFTKLFTIKKPTTQDW